MYKQQSLSKLSSKSLSKIKTKIELAFARPKINENQTKKQQIMVPVRSNSTKSLARSKYQSSEKNLPFSIAVKNNLIQTDRKKSAYHSQRQSNNRINIVQNEKQSRKGNQQQQNYIKCHYSSSKQSIAGWSWYHKQGKQLISLCKSNKDQLLRYFAIRQQKNGKINKKIVAALQQNKLYAGSKNYLLIKSSSQTLIDKNQASMLEIKGCDFVLVIDEKLLNVCNISRMIRDIYGLILDGLKCMDTIANIVGRRISELYDKNKQSNEIQEVFVLIILIQKQMNKINFPKTVEKANNEHICI